MNFGYFPSLKDKRMASIQHLQAPGSPQLSRHDYDYEPTG